MRLLHECDAHSLQVVTLSNARRIFINSVPKSGTNLLKRLLELLGYRDQNCRSARRRIYQRLFDVLGLGTPWSLHHGNVHRHVRVAGPPSRSKTKSMPVGLRSTIRVPVPIVRAWLEDVPPGYFFTGHVPWSRTFENLLEQLDYCQIVIFRDPLDVITSRLKYEQNWSRIRYGRSLTGRFLNVIRWLIRSLPGLDVTLEDELRKRNRREVLTYLLKGGRSEERNDVHGLLDQYRMMTPWTSSERTHAVLFRNLIGPEGSGSRTRQRTAVQEIARFLNLSLSSEQRESVVRRIYNPRSKTFRRGSTATDPSIRNDIRNSSLEQPLAEIYSRLDEHVATNVHRPPFLDLPEKRERADHGSVPDAVP